MGLRVEQGIRRSSKRILRLLPYESPVFRFLRRWENVKELLLYDNNNNSKEADPGGGKTPEPKLLLHLVGGRINRSCDPFEVPEWAKPVVAAAMKLGGKG